MSLRDIRIVPSDAFNLRIVKVYRQTDGPIDLAPSPSVHHWFAGTLTNLPTDREVTLRILMDGPRSTGYPDGVKKWVGLHPLLTYADPTRYESYQWFQRDADGQWVSGDITKAPHVRAAGSGLTPDQQVIPAELAAEFLSPDGRYWCPWRDITTAEALPEEKMFVIRHRFAQSTATVALHVPYNYAYLQAFVARLQAAGYPGVSVDVIGATGQGRPLYVIRVDDPDRPTPITIGEAKVNAHGIVTPNITIEPAPYDDHRVFLVTAREHGTEHTPSWVVTGVLSALLEDTPEARRLRRNTTWLLMPMYDVDGVVESIFGKISMRFYHNTDVAAWKKTPSEVIAVARYLRAFVNSGRPIFVTTSLYGLECNEAEPVVSPFMRQSEVDVAVAYNTFWYPRLGERNIYTHNLKSWFVGFEPHRLECWCADSYGALMLTFEINDRYPMCRLTRQGVEEIGRSFAGALVDFCELPIGQRRMQATGEFLAKRAKQMRIHYRRSALPCGEQCTLQEMLSLGY